MFNLLFCSSLSERSSATVPPTICGVKKQSLATCLPSMPVDPVQTLKKAKVKVTDIPAKASSVSRHGLPVTKTGKREELCNLNETLKLCYYYGIQSQANQYSSFP